MKPCAYCGRENLDSATLCSECGTDEFVAVLPPIQERIASEAAESAAKASASLRIEAAARAEMEKEHLKVVLPQNHYLLNSTDEELVEIVAHSSEWSGFDVAHARRLIGQRGIDLKKVEDKRAEHIHQLRRGKRASKRLIFCGWLFSFLGGLIGVGIAWSLVSMKEKTRYGEFFVYDEESRAVGGKMLKLAVAVVAVGVVLRLTFLLAR
jgi:GGDEF domain-containing protein